MTRKDQADAAAKEAARQTRAGGPLGKRMDLSNARIVEKQEGLPRGAAKLLDRFKTAITTTRLDPCPHVERIWGSGSAIPLHWAAWRPDRAACARCFVFWLVPDTSGHATREYCDLCDAERPTDNLQVASGPFVVHGDVCDECQGKT